MEQFNSAIALAVEKKRAAERGSEERDYWDHRMYAIEAERDALEEKLSERKNH